MCKKELVSVIIPVFNRPVMVKNAIESVLNQNYENYEILIVDDGSTDNTKEILESYAHEKKIEIIRMDHSGFPGLVRNKAVSLCRGNWLAFLDSDDIWLSEKLNKQMNFIRKNENIEFIHTKEKWLRKGKTISQKHRKHDKEGNLFDVSLGKCEIGPSTVLMSKDLFISCGNFCEDLEICEDYEFWLRVCASTEIFYIDEELVVKNAGHDDQLSYKYDHIEFFKIAALRKILDYKKFSPYQRQLVHKEYSKKCKTYANGCKKRGKILEAEKYESLHLLYLTDDDF